MTDAHAYNVTIRRAEFDGEVCYEARVRELPDLVDYADTADEAYALAVDSIETTAEALAEKGRAMSGPHQPSEEFSGRVTLRLPRSLHRALAEAADIEGVSLNQHLVNVISYFSGFAAGRVAAMPSAWRTVAAPVAQPGAGTAKVAQVVYLSELPRAAGWA